MKRSGIRKKSLFVFAAAIHAFVAALFGILETTGQKPASYLINTFFLFIYLLFFLYCIAGDLFSVLKKSNNLKILRMRFPYFVVHVSSLLLVAGLIYSHLYFYKGSIILTEGEIYNEGSTPYLLHAKGIFTDEQEFKEFLKNREIQLLKLKFDENSIPVLASMAIRENNNKRVLIFRPNEPAKLNDHYFFVTNICGFSPRLRVTGDNLTYIDAYLALKSSRKEGIYEDSFFLQGIGKIFVRYYAKTNKVEVLDKDKKHLASIGFRESAVFDDLTFEFVDVRKWSKIDITLDRTSEFIFIDSLMLLASISYVFLRKRGSQA